ncbi:hypothetical protein SCHPADRAFT_367946 [Schizopora paradoxa]|uniref:Uncharacterized protein n=1 Tax=Schizopora paradoxa TaxID=27342 RepID=A0A0H2RVJ0_9AGAM|nr:hypothetical protein SCHPADRAFT_367946 [Schizopora paradoxa]
MMDHEVVVSDSAPDLRVSVVFERCRLSQHVQIIVPNPPAYDETESESFVHRLPDEVLELVFLDCFPTTLPDEPTTDFIKAILANAPCNISQVCSRWRVLVLSLPALWAQWFVSIRDVPPVSVWKLTGILDSWRERSKDELLTAFIVVEGRVVTGSSGRRKLEGDKDARDAMTALLELVCAQEERWKRIKLGVYAPRASIAHRPLEIARLPNLEELHMYGLPCFETARDSDSEVQGQAPVFTNLRKLVLGDARCVLHGSAIARRCMALLKHAPHLETFEVLMSAPSPDFPSNSELSMAIRLPKLRCLLLEVRKQPAENFICKYVLDHIEAPALKTLYVKSRHRGLPAYDPRSSTYVSEFLARSCPPLEKLTVFMPMTEGDLVGIVRQVPTLTGLYLDQDVDARTQFFGALLEGEDDGALVVCPSLQRLKIYVYPEDVPLALDVLASRWRSSFTQAVRRAATAMWKESLEGIKIEVTKEDMSVLDEGWEEKFEQWAAGEGSFLIFGKSSLAEHDAKPSLKAGLF